MVNLWDFFKDILFTFTRSHFHPQLDTLVQEHIPDLYVHFQSQVSFSDKLFLFHTKSECIFRQSTRTFTQAAGSWLSSPPPSFSRSPAGHCIAVYLFVSILSSWSWSSWSWSWSWSMLLSCSLIYYDHGMGQEFTRWCLAAKQITVIFDGCSSNVRWAFNFLCW